MTWHFSSNKGFCHRQEVIAQLGISNVFDQMTYHLLKVTASGTWVVDSSLGRITATPCVRVGVFMYNVWVWVWVCE